MKKLNIGLLALATLGLAWVAYGQTARETVEKRRIERAVELGTGDFVVDSTMVDGSGNQYTIEAVGSIKQSILTEAQFQAQAGTDWVAMKGQSVAGSVICVTYSLCTLPDARNRFLRNSDAADTSLRGLVSDSTAKNGLDLTGDVAGGTASLSGSVSGGTASNGSLSVSDSGHTHGYVRTDFVLAAGDVAGVASGMYNGTQTTVSTGSTSANVSLSGSISSTAASNGTLAVSNTAANNGTLAIDAGDSETAPDHIIVNTFVKIN